MINNRVLSFLLSCVCLSLTILKFTCYASMAIAKPGCNTTCGNLTVPYPFGIGLDEECALDKFYIINCNYSYNPPKAFIGTGNLEVMNISLISGQLRIINSVATTHYENEVELGSDSVEWISMDLKSYPIVFSDTANKLTVVGCDDYAFIVGLYGEKFRTGCIAGCSNPSDVIEESCSGIGCCQISIPKGLKSFNVSLKSLFNHADVSNFNPYGYAFLAEQDKFRFDVNDLNNPNFRNRTMQNVPVVIDWYVGIGQNCVEAQENISYACQNNTKCTDFEDDATSRGYRCSCLPGYEGNPYLSPGCTDIDECKDSKLNTCSHICTNIGGGHNCSCPKGYHGDGQKSGTSCVKNPSYLATKLSLELLTREKHLCPERKIEERNLATYFLKAFKEDRLMEILDPQLVREASEDQLIKMAKLVKECLNVKGEDRPTMKEVVVELEGFKKPNTHSWLNQNNQEAINFIGEQDLYNVPSSTIMEYSDNYSMEISLIADINHPR